MTGEWRFNSSVHRAKGFRLVRARALPVCDHNLFCEIILNLCKPIRLDNSIHSSGRHLIGGAEPFVQLYRLTILLIPATVLPAKSDSNVAFC